MRSINASGHRYGLAPLGVGWVVWREKSDLPEDLIFFVNYLGGNMQTFALNFSRPGGQIIRSITCSCGSDVRDIVAFNKTATTRRDLSRLKCRSLARSRFYSTATVARAFQRFAGR